MPISELKDQATINSIDLNLDKAHAKLSLTKLQELKERSLWVTIQLQLKKKML